MIKKTLATLSCAIVIFGNTIILPAHATLPAVDSQNQPLPSLAPMLGKVTPAVVNISTEGVIPVQDNPLLRDPFFRFFFDAPNRPQRERRIQSLGSGVIIDAEKGYILTNNHVIDKAVSITVTLQNDRRLGATLIGTDPEADIAVIQVPAKDLSAALPLADSDQLQVGDFVVAIGNPFGLGQTVTSGIVSALSRSGLGLEGYEDFIQTDASINPGNSGGALVNLRGELIGINTAILAPNGSNSGIGFAIPINMAKQIMAQLVEFGEVRRGRLGIGTQDLTPDLAKAFNIQQEGGVVVVQVVENSAAAKAGVQIGDIITKINDRNVRTSSDLRNTIGLLRVDQKVDLIVLRDGKEYTASVVITEPEQTTLLGEKIDQKLTGAVFGLIDETSPLFNKTAGIIVLDVAIGSPASRAGLRKGDIIVAVNRIAVNDFDNLGNAVKTSDKGILMNVRRGNAALFIIIQ